MAYITKDEVKAIEQKLKKLLKPRGIKFSINGSNSSTVTVILREYDASKNTGEALDFSWVFDSVALDRYKVGYADINPYWFKQHYENNPAIRTLFSDIYGIIKENHWDESDIMADYLNCSFYAYLKVGVWNKPFEVK